MLLGYDHVRDNGLNTRKRERKRKTGKNARLKLEKEVRKQERHTQNDRSLPASTFSATNSTITIRVEVSSR